MSKDRGTPRAAGLCLLAAGLGAVFAAPSAFASTPTDPASCQASALELSLPGSGEPISASSTPCGNEYQAMDVDLLDAGVVKVTAVEASTATDATGASSTARVADVDLGISAVSSELAAPLVSATNGLREQFRAAVAGALAPGGQLSSRLAPLEALGLDTSGIDSSALFDATDVAGILDATLPDLVTAEVITATARATCTAGRAQLSSGVDLTGLRVLGAAIDADDPVGRAVTLDSTSLTLGQLVSSNDVLRTIKVRAVPGTALALLLGTGERSLYDLLVSPGGPLGTINAALPLGTTLQTIRNGLSTGTAPLLAQRLEIPAALLQVKVSPSVTTNDGTTASGTALAFDVAVAGRSVLNGALARASVGTDAANCVAVATPTPVPTATPTPTPAPTVTPTPIVTRTPGPQARSLSTQALLQCGDAPVRLVDVRRVSGKTLVKGVAQAQYAGQTASIMLVATGKSVGTAKIAGDGSFRTSVALPSAAIRSTNAARYYAVVQAKRSNKLKFERRMVVTKVTTKNGYVTMSGHTTLPRADKQAPVVLQRRVNCTKFVNVGTARPDRQGRFTATFKSPAGVSYAIYRAQTKVPKRAGSTRTFATYTLPQLASFR